MIESTFYYLILHFLQFVLFTLFHPNWNIRKVAYGSSKKILAAVPQLSEVILLEFSKYLCVVSEKAFLMKAR